MIAPASSGAHQRSAARIEQKIKRQALVGAYGPKVFELADLVLKPRVELVRVVVDLLDSYGLHITGGGLEKTRMMEGSFTIKPGATQNG